MTKPKHMKKSIGTSPDRLTELRRATFIASTGVSVRLAGSKVTNEEVEQIIKAISRPSEQKRDIK